MKKRRLGIECSGFIAQILDAWTRAHLHKKIFQALVFPSAGLYARIARWLRPFTHIDVATLTHPANAEEFSNWRQLRAGDIIRFNTEIDHAILITRVEFDQNTIPSDIAYVHSVREENGEGIKEGRIAIQDASAELNAQHWEEAPDTGQTIQQRGNPRFYHLRFLN
jgi:hypothetical protein